MAIKHCKTKNQIKYLQANARYSRNPLNVRRQKKEDGSPDHLLLTVRVCAGIKRDIRTREQQKRKGWSTEEVKSEMEQNAIQAEIGVEECWNKIEKSLENATESTLDQWETTKIKQWYDK